MSLFNPIIISQLEGLINFSDGLMRHNFHRGVIVDENDYTSNLTSHIRERINESLPLIASTFSQKLPGGIERKWGADAIIIMIDHQQHIAKVALFEAKTDRPNWDYIQPNSSPPVSHFSSQLNKQVNAINLGFAVWEQFYTNEDLNSPLGSSRNQMGSSCIFHRLASLHHYPMPNSTIWQDQDVDSLCKFQTTIGWPITMGGIIRSICECHYGEVFSLDWVISMMDDFIDFSEILIIEGSVSRKINPEELVANIFARAINNKPSLPKT
jgi:hypothetical protein